MAERGRHAAGHERYEVREVHDTPSRHLGVRFACACYLDAVDFALSYLQDNDPLRAGEVDALEIIRIEADGEETVWTYCFDPAHHDEDLIQLWGFDVARGWQGPVRC